MINVDATGRSIRLLVIFSAVYTLFEKNVAFLAPIITIAIPYKFMKEKDITKNKENKNLLNRLFIFNLLAFIAAVIITKKINLTIFDLIVNIAVTFIYYKVLCLLDIKRENLYENPEVIYNKINRKINALENLYKHTEETMENSRTEKERKTLENKLAAIEYNINDSKRKLELLKKQVEENNKKDYK